MLFTPFVPFLPHPPYTTPPPLPWSVPAAPSFYAPAPSCVTAPPTQAALPVPGVLTLGTASRDQVKLYTSVVFADGAEAAIEGVYVGTSFWGQAAICVGAKMHWVDWRSVQVVACATLSEVPFNPRGVDFAVRRRLDAHLACRVSPHHRLSDVVAALGEESEVYLTGGVLRDIFQTTDAALAPQDIDLSVAAVPSRLRGILSRFGSNTSKPITAPEWHGFFSLGDAPGAVHLDISCMRTRDTYAPKRAIQSHRGRPVHGYPVVFGHDIVQDAMARDFCCNALYYDFAQQVLHDPTGFGLQDARDKVLRLPTDAYVEQNAKLAWRFVKFLARGYTADPQTHAYMLRNAQFFWPRAATPQHLQAYIRQDMQRTHASAATCFERLRTLCHAQQLGNLFDAYALPRSFEAIASLTALADDYAFQSCDAQVCGGYGLQIVAKCGGLDSVHIHFTDPTMRPCQAPTLIWCRARLDQLIFAHAHASSACDGFALHEEQDVLAAQNSAGQRLYLAVSPQSLEPKVLAVSAGLPYFMMAQGNAWQLQI